MYTKTPVAIAPSRARRSDITRPVLLLALWLGLAPPGLAQDNEDESLQHIDEIVITATRTEKNRLEVPVSIAVQDLADLRRNGFTVGPDEYRGVTGVFFRRGEGDADAFPFVSFRGSTGTEGSIGLIDGIPLIGIEGLEFNQIPYDAVDQIEIVKGPVSALYGRGALYGATNYITRTPDEDAVTARATAGSDDFFRADVSLERNFGERGGLLLAGSYEDYAGWREQNDRQVFNIFAKASVELTPRTTLSGYLNYNDRDVDMPNGRPLRANGEILPFAGGDEGFIGFGEPNSQIENLFTVVAVEHRVNDDLSFTVRGSYRDIDSSPFWNFYDPFGRDLDAGIVGYNGFHGPTTQEVFYGEAIMRWTTGRHDIVAGVTGEQSDSKEQNFWTGQFGFTAECDFTFFLIEVDFATGAVLNENHPCFERNSLRSDRDFENTFWGAFIQNEITLSERWRLTLGLRYDDFSRDAVFLPIEGVTDGGLQSSSADAFSPKAALSYLTDWGQVYAAYGRGFDSNFGPSFEWNPVSYARPETRPTTIDSFELGIKGRFLDDTLRAEAIVFYSEQKNRRQIVDNPAAEDDFSQPGRLITFGDLYKSQGLELSLVVTPTGTTTIQLNYTYLDPEWDEFVVDTFAGPADFSGNTPVGVPDHIFYLQANQDVTEWLSFRGIVEYYSDYFYTVDNEFSDGSYSLVTLGAQLAPTQLDGITFDLTVTNVFDETYYSYFGNRTSPTSAIPGPPQQVRLAVTARF